MNQSLTVEIINEGAINLLRDMEYMRLIRLNGNKIVKKIDWRKYRGAMTKQSVEEIDKQLNELRNAWI